MVKIFEDLRTEFEQVVSSLIVHTSSASFLHEDKWFPIDKRIKSSILSLVSETRTGLDRRVSLVPTKSGLFKLSKYLKIAVLAIIEDSIHQLQIVTSKETSEIGVMTRRTLMPKTLSERFAEVTSSRNVADGDHYTDCHKIQKERKYMIAVLKELFYEIDIFSGVMCIEMFVETHYEKLKDEDNLLDDVTEKEKRVHRLREELRVGKDKANKKMREIDVAIEKKNIQMKDVEMEMDMSRRYIREWELSRQEQNTYALEQAEDECRSAEYPWDFKILHEESCHDKMAEFISLATEDLQLMIEDWMEKYDNEMDMMDLQLAALRYKISKIEGKKEKLQRIYEERDEEIKIWLEDKRRRREEQEEMLLRIFYATRIQAWWRGVMYRKSLGPYRKKKGKKNAKNKKDEMNKQIKKGRNKKSK